MIAYLSFHNLFKVKHLIWFGVIYRAPKISDFYEHQILNIRSQSLNLYEKWLIMQYTAVLRH